MAATNKADLLALTEKEYAKLAAGLADVTEAEAGAKDAEDTSIKDVVGHRAHWIDLFLGWYRDGQAGREVAFPAPGYKWNELKRYNADLRARQAGISWAEATEMLADREARLVALIEALDDAALYGGPMKGAQNAWTAGRWAEAAGPSHFRSAAKYLRGRLRQLR
ncbi:ClbS/DfsB family four-helix bundle protein [Psychromarinibacter sp. C21-152]|uniref:ClbS/DfsB family four-helix bundle protein n=1 Tax=Psychromarinibacter sediminicola TaxID=3033385 RepID=A0AAE3NPI8_9RHOB|nr:ClbS/DfsB family four-helix bundle protein [Psychromarinibacter sediminicola]MDF0601803.1 ClbS/DfsB family four-helix bundle protein [Psychromarinibacter sediminicola]